MVYMNEVESKSQEATNHRLRGEDLRGLLPDMIKETKLEKAFSTLEEGESISRFGASFVMRRGLLYEARPAKKSRIYVPRSMVDKVIKRIHTSSHNHARTPRLLPWLEERFVWHDGNGKLGREATVRVPKSCHACELVGPGISRHMGL